MSDYTTRTTCRVCGSKDLVNVINLGDQYVSDFVEKDRVDLGPKCPIDVDLCRGCSLVQARHTARQDFLYSRHYWYRSGVTDTMKAALKDVVDSAVSAVGGLSHGDVVLDIGSNDGTLLRYYPRSVYTIGVEPASNLVEEGRRGISLLINDFWSYGAFQAYTDLLGGKLPKIITACGMFYDLEDPNQFIRDVSAALAPGGLFVAQLMCLKQTLDRGDVGNLAHEHLEFYSLESLHHLFLSHGLAISDVVENNVNGGSYRIFARKAPLPLSNAAMEGMERRDLATNRELYHDHLRSMVPYEAFRQRAEAARDSCRAFIINEVLRGKKVWVYGASTKGNVILQYYGLNDRLIPYAADRSPEKVGKFTAGTGIEVRSEADFREANPDYALVLPYAFLPEFLQREREWRSRGGRFIVPLPEFKVV